MDKRKIYLIIGLLVIAVGLLIYGTYYLFTGSNEDVVSTSLEAVTSSASSVDQIAIRDLDIEVTLDTLPSTDGLITEVDYETFESLFKTSKRSILVLTSSMCSNCTEFLPELESALSSLGITAYKLVLENLGEDESATKYLAFNGTPTTYIIENGNVTHSFTGSTSSKVIAAFLDLYYVR